MVSKGLTGAATGPSLWCPGPRARTHASRKFRILSAAHHSASAPCCAARGTRGCVLATCFVRGLSFVALSLKAEGQGNAGCTLHPRSRVRCLRIKTAHEHTGEAEAVRHPLRNGFTAYIVISPVNRCVTVTLRDFTQGLTPAWQRQNHTTSSYAAGTSSWRQQRPPQPIPTYGGDGRRPSSGMRWPVLVLICRSMQGKYFCGRGLTLILLIRITMVFAPVAVAFEACCYRAAAKKNSQANSRRYRRLLCMKAWRSTSPPRA